MDPRAARGLAVRFLVAVVLLQAAWILAVPPFRGSDEFDHAYRADAVAHGQWAVPSEQAAAGRGGLLAVRRSIVGSAGAICESYSYTGRDNCQPGEEVGEGLVRVASGASGNHPLFYWVIGTAALPFEGADALLAMRAAGALMSALLLTMAAYFLAVGSRSRWPVRGLAVGCTPVLVYSTSVAAPNGVEMAAGAAVWGGLIALGAGAISPARERLTLIGTILAGIILVVPRQLGPLWLLLIVTICLVLFGARHWWAVLKRRPLLVGVGSAAIAAAAINNVLWVSAAGTLTGDEVNQDILAMNPGASVLGSSLKLVPLWAFQSIAAFPLRDEPAPIIVYACYLVVVIALLGAASWRGDARVRWATWLTAGLGLLVPFLITYATIARTGSIWQGRYALAFTVGLPILASLALASGGQRLARRWSGPVLLAMTIAVVVAHGVSVLNLYRDELTNPAAVGDGSPWPFVPGWALVAVVVLALAALASLASGRDRRPTVDAPDDDPEGPVTGTPREQQGSPPAGTSAPHGPA